MIDYCIIIPAFNEEKNLNELLDDLKTFVNKERIIVVDDGSEDETSTIAKEAGVMVITHKTNLGKGEALKSGFINAGDFPWIMTMDGDLQHKPSDVSKFIERAEKENADIIIGSRMSGLKKMPFHRILYNKITSFLISVRIGQNVEDSQCGYRMIKRDVIKSISLKKKGFSYESEFLLKAGLKKFKIDSVNIETIYNNSKSSINPFLDTKNFILVFISSLFWRKR